MDEWREAFMGEFPYNGGTVTLPPGTTATVLTLPAPDQAPLHEVPSTYAAANGPGVTFQFHHVPSPYASTIMTPPPQWGSTSGSLGTALTAERIAHVEAQIARLAKSAADLGDLLVEMAARIEAIERNAPPQPRRGIRLEGLV